MPDFQTEFVRCGLGGLDLKRSPDVVAPQNCLRLTNAQRTEDGAWTSRFGQTSLATSGGTVLHSIQRADDPMSSTETLHWGIDTSLYEGTTGALTSLESGFSGNPLALVPWRVAQSGESWMIVGDTAKMRKVRVADGLVLPIGLPADATPASVALDSANSVTIASFSGTAGSYTGAAGTALSGIPVLANVGASGSFPAGMSMTTTVGTVTGPYYSVAYRAVAVDLSTYGGGVDATDDDYMHLWVRLTAPQNISEVRIYLVLGTFTGSNVLPGTGTVNKDAYLFTFRPSDIDPYVQGTSSNTSSVTTDVVRRQINRATGGPRFTQDQDGSVPIDGRDIGRAVAGQQTPGANVWTEWGTLDIPLKRGDAQRIGTDTTLGWANVSGIMIGLYTTGAVVAEATVADFYLTGGAGPDSGDADTQPYDYRYTHYDPRTGAEGNGSDEMAEANYINALRRGIDVTPAAYGDATVRQRFYRRGGTLNDNWYYVGENASDGGVFTDTLSDAEIEAAGTVPTDFFEAVPSVDADGNAVLAQPVPYVWGPVNDMVFAAGDPNRPGSVYFCYPGEVDKWGADNYVDVCAPGEAIQNGFVYAGQSFAWSSQRLYAITPNLIDALTITPSPTSCTKAPAGPWAFTVGPSAVYFLANDGVYVTTGGEAVNLSDEWLKPLFQGQTSNGLLPIDFTATADMRLAVWRNDVWVQYKDSGGTTRFLLYNLLDQSWRHYSFGVGTKTIYADVTPGVQRLLMGGSTTGDAYTYTGTSDDGANIAVAVRHPVLNQGQDIANKLYSDLTVDADRQSTTLTVTPYLSNETTAATALTINSGSGRQRYTYNFNPQPTSSQNVAYDIAWSSAANTPRVYGLQTSYVVDPAAAQHKGIDWEDLGDTYYTGLDLDIDTGNLAKTCNVYVDQTLVATTTVQTNGRRLFHITLGPARGHLYRYDFSDSNPARIWGHKWHVEVEPSEQTNWNQNFTPLDGLSNKYLKGVALDCDTFGVAKTVQLQADGGVITTITVNQNGRGIQHFGFPATQGRLVRILPVDGNPGRLYSATWIYDDQPFSLTAWDSNWDNLGDSYYTGINIEINTFNVAKTFSFAVDGTTISTQSVTTNGRQVVKLSFTPARGSTFRFFSTDTTVAQLFSYQWQVDKEPSTQANWNQNYTPLDGLANKYIKGVALDCDTFGATKTIQVQGDGAVLTTLSVTQNGRGIQHFGFPASQARLLRLLPTDTNQGRLYAAHWIYDDQPFVLTVWDSNWENKGDTYYTGLNIEVDTFGVDKVFNFYVDQTLIDSQTINANGRTLVHITLPPGRGHLYRWTSTDSVVAQVYGHQWMLDAEPSEQANWNQNFTISGTLADKAVKGVLLECDTFGEDKSVEIQIDGTTHTTLTVNTDGRKVVQFSFAQGIGRVLRLLPVDDHPGRLYSIQWIFDTEPLKLDRWETQPITHGIPTWQIPVEAQLTLKSTALVVLTLTTYLQSSTTITKTYYIPSTAGEKRKLFVPFEATKGVMFKYLFTSAEPFYLFREESSVRVQPWGSQEPVTVHPFGNDDLDPSRGMGVASLQAATPGGSAT